MKEELQSKLVEILTSIQATVGKASDFASAQLPDIAQSYIAYGRAWETAAALAAFACLVGAIFVGLRYGLLNKSAVHKDGWNKGGWMDYRIGATMGGLAASIVSLVALSSTAPPALLVWLAPKVWLLQQLAGMLRAGR